MTGQSSIRGMCVWPNVYQTTRSVCGDAAVGLRPLGQAVAAGVLVRVIARREPFLGMERRDPEVLGQEARPLEHRRAGLGERKHVLSRGRADRRLAPPRLFLRPG